MNYTAWTPKDIEARILEAAETLMLMPNVRLPSAVPAIWREYKDEYGKAKSRYRRRPLAVAIDRMYQTWEWINALEKEADRKLLYGWAYVKVRKGMKLSSFALENMMNDRMLRRKIDQLTQVIANNLNRLRLVRLTDGVDPVSENDDNFHQQTVSSEKCVRSWMAPDAKPVHLPEFHKESAM